MPPSAAGYDATCSAAFRDFAAGQFTAWRGLSEDCPASALKAVVAVDDDLASSLLGEEPHQAFFHVVTCDWAYRARAWTTVEDRVLLLDTEFPELDTGVAALLEAFGEPEARLDYRWDVLQLPHGELVYPARGITLVVNPENQVLLRLLVYASTSLDLYRGELRPVSGIREFR